jgi:hypothetical protein
MEILSVNKAAKKLFLAKDRTDRIVTLQTPLFCLKNKANQSVESLATHSNELKTL